jgi:hypothetical protein
VLFGWKGVPLIINWIITLIVAIVFDSFGFILFSPFAFLIGAFIAGLLYRDTTDGAIYGFIAAAIIGGIIGIIIVSIVFFMIVSIVLMLVIDQFLSAISLFSLILLIAVLLSPVTGAAGGFSGEQVFGKKESKFVFPIPQPSEILNTEFVCPNCGNTNASSSKFCVQCGSSLRG